MAHKTLHDVTLFLHHATDKSWLVSETNDREKAVWIPMSQCEKGDAKGRNAFEFTVPEWLMFEKGFL